MKTLIVYYSLDGNTRLIAETIRDAISGDAVPLKPVKGIRAKGLLKILWGVKQVLMKEMPELEPLEIRVEDYERIFIGTPVWAGTYAPPLNSFFAANKIEGKSVAFFCCHGGAGKVATFKNLKKALRNNTFIGELELKEPLRKNTDAAQEKARVWARGVVSGKG